MVFVSAMIVQQKNAQEIIDRCKAAGKTVVAGGPAFTTQHEKFTGVDHFIQNEAEVTLPPFLDDLKNGKAKHVYTSTVKPDLALTPVPMWSLIDLRDYAAMVVQYSRGCPFDCEFCDITATYGRIARTKTPEQIMNEIDSLYLAGWKGSLFIVDDNFIGNKKEVKKILPLLAQWQEKHNYPFKILTEASVNLADDEELMRMMSKANFNKVFLGIETPCAESLKECGKKQNLAKDLTEVVRIIQRHGLEVTAGFIVGFDNDPDSIFEAQIEFIQRSGVVTAMVGLLTALPQTRLWRRLSAEGRIVQDTSGNNTDGSLNFVPKMGREELLDGYKKILSVIYLPKHYYERVNILMTNYRHTAKGKMSKEEYKLLFKSMWKIGFSPATGILYWKTFLKTCFTNRKAIPLVVELAIYELHFREVAKKVLNV